MATHGSASPSNSHPAYDSPEPGLTVPFGLVKTCLRQVIARHSISDRPSASPLPPDLAATIQTELEGVATALSKLDQRLIRIAVFGLVSRGKSAVLNALLGDKLLATGPLNGVTQQIRTERWRLPTLAGEFQVELVDTPGLDEIDGAEREQMARQVAQQADLILFVAAGDLTRTEYQAMRDLRRACKPMLLVFNKIDLYPEGDRRAIVQTLQNLWAEDTTELDDGIQNPPIPWLKQSLAFTEANIIRVAADPKPLQVRVEWPDGRVTHEWETPAPQVDDLRQTILSILTQDGAKLLALNALNQAREAERTIAQHSLTTRQQEAEDLIWQFASTKAMAVALNPIAGLDLLGGLIADLALIRALAKLYNLPMTSYQAGKLLKQIVFSTGGLLLGELGSSLIWGVGKTVGAIATALDNPLSFGVYAGAISAQAALAGYGAYRIGRAAQVYLEQGCTWDETGANTVIRQLWQ